MEKEKMKKLLEYLQQSKIEIEKAIGMIQIMLYGLGDLTYYNPDAYLYEWLNYPNGSSSGEEDKSKAKEKTELEEEKK